MLLTVKTIKNETFKIETEPSATVMDLKSKMSSEKGYDAAALKLIHNGKILDNDSTVESYGISETGFIVAMQSPPVRKEPPPEEMKEEATPNTPAKTTTTEESPEADEKKETTTVTPPTDTTRTESAPNAPPPTAPSAPPPDPSPTTDPSSGALFSESTFLTGPALEETINNIKAMGFTEDRIRRALVVGYNNPDRAVELLVMNDPLLDQVGSSAQEQDERPREPTPGIALSGERSSSERGVTPEQGEEMDDTSGGGGGGAGVLPPGGEMSDMDTFEYLTRLPQFQLIRNAVQSNPAVLEPLLQTLQTQNPELFEQINQNRAEFFRLITNPAAGGAADSGEQTSGGAGESGGTRGSNPALAGSAAALAGLTDMSATPGPNDPRFVTVTLTPEEQAHIETIISFSGVSRQQAVEIFLLCDKNAELAINYIMDNQNDL